MTAMTFCSLSVLTMTGFMEAVKAAYSAMLPVMPGVLMVKSDSHSTMKSLKIPLVVHSRAFLNFCFLRKALNPSASAVLLGYR